jgi:putative peptidoglycan lipid II flippase
VFTAVQANRKELVHRPAGAILRREVRVTEDLNLRIRAVTLLLAMSSLLSRILGYGRDWLINYEFGATGATDVYQASFTLPDMINYLLAGGALSVSLLPRMSALYAAERNGTAEPGQDGLSHADRVFSIVFTAMLAVAIVCVMLGEVLAAPIIRAWFDGFNEQQIAQTVHLTRIVLPAQLFFISGGLIQASLLARQSFRAMALTPLLYNLGIIVGGLIGAQTGDISGFSWGALVGALFGGLITPAWSARKSLKWKPIWRPGDAEMKAFLWTALPLMVGVSLTTVDEWLGRKFGSSLQPGSISWLNAARKVMLVPIGLLGQAAGQATGTYIARLHADGAKEEMAQVLGKSLAAVLGLSLVLSVFLIALPEQIVGILFEYGKFGAHDTHAAASALVPLSVGIAAWGAQAMLARAFYATGDTWRPMIASTIVTLAMLPIYSASTRWGIAGLGASATIGMTAQALVLLVLARSRLALDMPTLLRGLARAGLVALVAFALVLLTDRQLATVHWMQQATPRVRHWLEVGVCGGVWLAVLILVGAAVDMPGLPRRLQSIVVRVRRGKAA